MNLQGERDPHMQTRAANAIAVLIENCQDPSSTSTTNPTAKIINNLASLLCQDTSRAPAFRAMLDVSGIYALEEEKLAIETKKTAMSIAQTAGVAFEDTDDGARASDGAVRALQALSARYHNDIFDKLPRLFEIVSTALIKDRDFSKSHMYTQLGRAQC